VLFSQNIPVVSVADPRRKNADADQGKNLSADPDANSCPYWTAASQVIA
jgi:hypothetical protein